MNTPDPASRREFIEFWALRYADKNEHLYTGNISCPLHTRETLNDLFHWKIGDFRFKSMLTRSVESSFLSQIERAKALPQDIRAEDFLREFPAGGAIHRIFWLHCWHPKRFPIYDQHVHRAMIFIQSGEIEELGEFGDDGKIEKYLRSYMPFYETFVGVDLGFDPQRDGIPGRKIDRALVTFGSCIQIPRA